MVIFYFIIWMITSMIYYILTLSLVQSNWALFDLLLFRYYWQKLLIIVVIYSFVMLYANYYWHSIIWYISLWIASHVTWFIMKVIDLCRCSKMLNHWLDYHLLGRYWLPLWVLPPWRRSLWEQRQIRCFLLASLMSMGSCVTASKTKLSHPPGSIYMWLCFFYSRFLVSFTCTGILL